VSHPVFSASGELVELVGTAVDVTERKRAEQELLESERRYRRIFQMVSVSIWQEDFSQLKAAIDQLKADGIEDFREYVAAHPEFVDQAISMIKIVDVNDVTLECSRRTARMSCWCRWTRYSCRRRERSLRAS